MNCGFRYYAADRRQCSSDADRFYANNHFNLGVLARCAKHAILNVIIAKATTVK